MKKLILLRGLPGSGKTTFADFLIGIISMEADVTVCAADDFFYDENGMYNFDASLLHKAHLSCQQDVEIAMQDGADKFRDWQLGDRYDVPFSIVIVHNTTTTPKEIKIYTDLAAKYGYEVTSLIVENRHGNKSVHGVPDEAMERMRNRFEVKL